MVRLWLWPGSRGAISAKVSTLRLPILSQTLLSASAVGSRIASLAVIAEGAAAGSPIRLLSVAAGRVALRLIEIIGTVLTLIQACAILLIQVPPILLIHRSAVLLIESWLIRVTQLLTIVLRQIVSVVLELRLIVFLIEFWGREVGVARVGIEIVGAIIVAVNVVPIDVIAVDIGSVDIVAIDVVPVVVVVAIDEGIRVGNIRVVVVDHGGVMPAASP